MINGRIPDHELLAEKKILTTEKIKNLVRQNQANERSRFKGRLLNIVDQQKLDIIVKLLNSYNDGKPSVDENENKKLQEMEKELEILVKEEELKELKKKLNSLEKSRKKTVIQQFNDQLEGTKETIKLKQELKVLEEKCKELRKQNPKKTTQKVQKNISKKDQTKKHDLLMDEGKKFYFERAKDAYQQKYTTWLGKVKTLKTTLQKEQVFIILKSLMEAAKNLDDYVPKKSNEDEEFRQYLNINETDTASNESYDLFR